MRVDNSAPNTSDDAPDEWVTGPVSLHLGATDALSGLDGILYSTDGSLPSLLVTGPITVSAEGTTSVRYRALDAVGNQSALATATVRVDNSAPNTSDDAPDEWVTGPVSLHLSATDALSGLDGILYSTTAHCPRSWSPARSPSALRARPACATAPLDAVGNQSALATATVRVDNSAPATSDDAPEEWSKTPVSVLLTPSDSLSGPATTRVPHQRLRSDRRHRPH